MSAPAVNVSRRWRPPPMIASPWLRRAVLFGALAYLAFAVSDMEFDLARFLSGIPRGGNMLASMFPPDFSRWELLFNGLIESLQMAIFATAIGVILSIPIAVGAATNVAPFWLYGLCRGYIALSRTFPEVLIAIFFVKAFGFGAFAGVLTLIIATTGFVGKLLAEEIEAIDPGQVEAMRATGASSPGVLLFGVGPQVLPRYIGLVIYRLDINLRESTILGIVGAGGLGSVLHNSFARYEYDFSMAILISIIAVVLVAEWFSGFVRARIQ
ncbi:MAG: phosphonate ABC transporter, permease protein PhnE [Halorhodospira sp.]